MTEHYYPALDEKPILMIKKLADASETYFEDEECPYSEDIKKLLAPPPMIDIEKGEIDLDNIDTEEKITSLISELEAYGSEKDKMSSADKNTYFRLSVTLMEKLVSLREKSSNLSKHDEFVSGILSILNDVCDADQRLRVQERLKKFM